MSQLAHVHPSEVLDHIVDAVVAEAGGDLRLALRHLVRRQHAIEETVSAGYVRRNLDVSKIVVS